MCVVRVSRGCIPFQCFCCSAKDLSHVPCKFFKVGSCTAGSSCPFSHTILEPGQQKEFCAWFIKGNCKFGHKCALAHVLPGQSMAMDRKNKKAAQAAANAASSVKDGHRQGRSQRSAAQGQQTAAANSRNPLLSGSTAPTRSHSSSRPPIPMPLKATLSPSTPAPPVHAADFASYGLPDESNKLPSAPAQGKLAAVVKSLVDIPSPGPDELEERLPPNVDEIMSTQPTFHATDAPSIRRTMVAHVRSADTPDFGPIGSPPRAAPTVHPSQHAELSPSGSPHVAILSSSPFSAPGSRSAFLLPEQKDSDDFRTRSGLSTSLGAMMPWTPNQRENSTLKESRIAQDDVAVEDGDLEEFIPGSLSELLTPEEKSRRFSRTNTTRPLVPAEREGFATQPSADGLHHRHSRSVPATSLLQEIRSIWTENPSAAVVEPGVTGASVTGGGLGNGTPSSFQSNTGFDVLAPSNASAAFLPGLHHFINNQATQRSSLTSGVTSLYSQSSAVPASQHVAGIGARNGLAQSPSQSNGFAAGTTFDGSVDTYLSHNQRFSTARPILGGDDLDDRRNATSPSTRALQAHAPGQSLPQGLAAGYSRIHALPPPPVLPSPSSSGAFSPGRSVTLTKGIGHLSSNDWHGSSPPASVTMDPPGVSSTTNGSLGGLDSMFSRLSYSAATSSQCSSDSSIFKPLMYLL